MSKTITLQADSSSELDRKISKETEGKKLESISHSSFRDGPKIKYTAIVVVSEDRTLLEG